LRTIDDRILKRPNSTWTDGHEWLPNAVNEHQRVPFQAIIAGTNPDGHAYVLDGTSLDETNHAWCVSDREVVQRNAAAMAGSIAPLLRASHELLFVDPHFDPLKIEFRNPLEQFLASAIHDRDPREITKVEIHAKDDDDKSSTQMFQERCSRLLPGMIPIGMSVHIYRWRQKDGGEKLHNRYVLTDLGGVRFEIGLDEGNQGETDDVSLLKPDAHQLRRSQYAGGSTAFEQADHIEIIGAKQ
jgi:hypothetical protein